MRVTEGDSGFCCCAWGTTFERWLIPLYVDLSYRAHCEVYDTTLLYAWPAAFFFSTATMDLHLQVHDCYRWVCWPLLTAGGGWCHSFTSGIAFLHWGAGSWGKDSKERYLLGQNTTCFYKQQVVFCPNKDLRAQELCESRGGRPGFPVPNKPTVSVDVKQQFNNMF